MKKLILPNEILMGEVERLLSQGTAVTIMTKGNSMLPFIVGERDSVVTAEPMCYIGLSLYRIQVW